MSATSCITREIFWNVKGDGFPIVEPLTYILALVAIVLMIHGMYVGGFWTRLKIAMKATG